MRHPKAPGWPERGERTEDPEVAERWKWAYVDLMREGHRRRVLGIPKGRTLGKAVEDYLEHRQSTRERATWSADRSALNHLLDAIPADRPLAQIEPSEVQEMIDRMERRGYNPTTLATYVKSIGTFSRWAGFALTEGVTTPDRGTTDILTLEPAECEKVREAASRVDRTQTGDFPSARLAVEIGLSMGLRQGEIFALRWEAVNEAERSVRVQWQIPKDGNTPKPLKGKRARTSLVLPEWWPLHREASGFIVARNGRTIGTRPQRNLIQRVLDAAGVNDVGLGWHLLRHTFARHVLEERGRMEELQRFLGHRSIVTTQRKYGHFREDTAVKLARERMYGVS